MGSDKYFFLLLAFFFFHVSGFYEEGPLLSKFLGRQRNGSIDLTMEDAENKSNNLIPYEDTVASLEALNNFKKGFGSKWVMMPNGLGVPVLSNLGNDSNSNLDDVPMPDITEETSNE